MTYYPLEECNCEFEGKDTNWGLNEINIKTLHDINDKWHYVVITVGDKESAEYAIRKLLGREK